MPKSILTVGSTAVAAVAVAVSVAAAELAADAATVDRKS